MPPQLPYYKKFHFKFPDEATCVEQILEIRNKFEHSCTKCFCNDIPVYNVNRRTTFCSSCSKETTVLEGTIFKNTKFLRQWFKLIWYWSFHEGEINAGELGQAISLSLHSTTKRMQKLRRAFTPVEIDKLVGHVEFDVITLRKGYLIVAISTGRGGRVTSRIKNVHEVSSDVLNKFNLEYISISAVVSQGSCLDNLISKRENNLDEIPKCYSSFKAINDLGYDLNRWINNTYRGTIIAIPSFQEFINEFCFRRNHRVKNGIPDGEYLFGKVMERAVIYRQP